MNQMADGLLHGTMDSIRTEGLLKKVCDNECCLRQKTQDLFTIETNIRTIVMDISNNELDVSKVRELTKNMDKFRTTTNTTMKCLDRMNELLDEASRSLEKHHGTTCLDKSSPASVTTGEPVQEEGRDKTTGEIAAVCTVNTQDETEQTVEDDINLRDHQKALARRKDSTNVDSGIAHSTGSVPSGSIPPDSIPSRNLSLPPQDQLQYDQGLNAAERESHDYAADLNDLNRQTESGSIDESVDDNTENQRTEPPRDSVVFIQQLGQDTQQVLEAQGVKSNQQRGRKCHRRTQSEIVVPRDPSSTNDE